MKSRKITNTGTLKNIGKFPSIKTGKIVWFESHLERDFIYLTEFDKDVIQYREQPFKVQYLLDGKKLNYFPDFLLERKSKKQVIEIKPQVKVKKDEFVRFSKIMTNHLAKQGYEYLVFTDSTIRLQPRLSNIQLLWRYARFSITTKHKIMLYELFCNSAQLSFLEICSFLNQEKEQRELVYALLFHGYLVTDIEKPITANSVLSIGDFN
ncbi:MAG: TnsA endonuclease N-terminal domain-containing protein [Acidobacteriota bacterium]|nr:TnsA endonuclease N-terminal domain-containing protein [Acidobacteriota bacterium]